MRGVIIKSREDLPNLEFKISSAVRKIFLSHPKSRSRILSPSRGSHTHTHTHIALSLTCLSSKHKAALPADLLFNERITIGAMT